MKVYFFTGALLEGGAERVISLLSREFVNKEIDVEIVIYKNCPIFYEIDNRIKVCKIESETKSNNMLKNIIWLRKKFQNDADLVISFLAPFNMLAIFSTLFSSIPIIVADRNDPKKIPSNFFVRKIRDIIYCFANGVVLQTKTNQEYFSEFIKKKSCVIYNPIDLKKLQGAALSANKEKEIVSVGRLMPQKNHIMLIRAFANIHQQYPNYKLTIYGDGPERSKLIELAKDLNLSDYISFPGNVKDVHERILSSEVFVLSSDYEGMPNALIEAMCLGLPVISTKVSGATDLIHDYQNGIVIDVNDSNGLVQALIKFLENETLRNKCAQNAVKLASSLKLDIISDEWIKFIYKILDKE